MKKIYLLLCLIILTFNVKSQELIKVVNVVHHEDGITDYQGDFRIQLPQILTGVSNPIEIMKSYQGMFNIIGLDTINSTYYAIFKTKILRMPLFKIVNDVTTNTLNMPEDYYNTLTELYNQFQTDLNNFQLLPSDAIIGSKWNGTTWSNN